MVIVGFRLDSLTRGSENNSAKVFFDNGGARDQVVPDLDCDRAQNGVLKLPLYVLGRGRILGDFGQRWVNKDSALMFVATLIASLSAEWKRPRPF